MSLYVSVVVIASWPHAVAEIIRERSPLGALSSMLLAASAALCLVLAVQRRPLFGVMAAGLFALAVDERFLGHERLKRLMLAKLFDYDRAAMGIIGDLPLLVVPVVGGVVLWRLRAEFAERGTVILFSAAFAAGVVALIFDIATLHPIGQLIEELLELTAETLFLLALLRVTLGGSAAMPKD